MTYAMNDESATYETQAGGTQSAPLGDVAAGRLELSHGAHDIRVRVEPDMPDLYRVRHEGPAPEISVEHGRVKMRFMPDWSNLGWLFRRGATRAVITLNGAIPWTVELRGGASLVDADLRGLDLRGLDVQGGVSKIEVRLAAPRGVCRVRFAGGATAFGLHRPAGTAARLRVIGGFNDLTFDKQLVAKMGGGFHVDSSGFEGAADYYNVDVTGGVSKLTIDTVAA